MTAAGTFLQSFAANQIDCTSGAKLTLPHQQTASVVRPKPTLQRWQLAGFIFWIHALKYFLAGLGPIGGEGFKALVGERVFHQCLQGGWRHG